MPKHTNPPPIPHPSPHSLSLPTSTITFALTKIVAFSALSPHGHIDHPKKVFSPIPSPNTLGIPSSEAVPSPKTPPFEEGQQIHSRVVRSGFGSSPFVETALVNFYAKCEEIGCARKVFHQIPERNLVSWSTMISGYSEVGMVNEAFSLFREMQKAGVVPDEVTLVSVISACAASGHWVLVDGCTLIMISI
ncbi:hypothetical protein Acr_12g0007770 [Actinidia rufa]|uniref:Tetratricopeptide repeat (TPR)-like superfamily protein n=1 Tax=Actinidia rufa TaxID=165716 RepID=A0A7J0FIF9_9ERIC|nr:hypothetical protein Acr_12g0007740 [Actinidia rufa]GFY98236.1 hypothetical protein Acr_12g0007770 [Actinidia rufa]